MRKIAYVLLAGCLLATTTTAMADGVLSKAEIEEILSGNIRVGFITGSLSGRVGQIKYLHNPDGSLSAKNEWGGTGNGTWQVSDDGKLCIDWKNKIGSRATEGCFSVEGDKETISFARENFKIRPGSEW